MDHSLAGQLAGDLTLLMQPKIAKSHLEMLSNKIIETLGLFDGLFSDSEKYFVIAKLLDLVHQIPRLGPTRGLMCLAGERSLSKVKKLVPKGGVEISYRKVETMVSNLYFMC